MRLVKRWQRGKRATEDKETVTESRLGGDNPALGRVAGMMHQIRLKHPGMIYPVLHRGDGPKLAAKN